MSMDIDAVRQALAAGKLSVPDPATGYHRSIYADCPHDGQPALVRRVVRGPRQSITELRMRCPRCLREFTPGLESLYLR